MDAGCLIDDVVVEQLDCSSNGLFAVVVDFYFENVSDEFTVSGNGQVYGTFSYDELPIIIDGLIGDGQTCV